MPEIVVNVQPPSLWGPRGACADSEDDIFFPVEDYKILPEHAKRAQTEYCNHCEVIRQCRQFALACDPDPGGIWGGTTPRERNKLRKSFASTGVLYATSLVLNPEEFAPEPRSHLLARLASEDRLYQDSQTVELSPEPIRVTVSMSRVELSEVEVPAISHVEAFPDPNADLFSALQFLGIPVSNTSGTYS